jgi:CheY-like chemotaxis protein
MNPCVLVVDDDPDVRDVMCEAVAMAGCSALAVASGAEALDRLREVRPCLVVLDLLMPVMSGAEVQDAMRNDPRLAAIPVVFATSAPERVPAGSAVLPKPLNVHAFLAYIRQRCDSAADPTAGRRPTNP